MDNTDIYRCFQILNEEPKLFFQKENIADKLQCFDTIQKVGTPGVIDSLMRFWLLKVERVNLNEVHDHIIQFILKQQFSEEFYIKINRLDDKTRLRFYKTYLGNKHPTKEQINRISADKNFLVRLELIKHLSAFDIDTQRELIAALTSVKQRRCLKKRKRYCKLRDSE